MRSGGLEKALLAQAHTAVDCDAMDDALRHSALQLRATLASKLSPATFREALTSVPVTERDAWLNLVLNLEAPPDDGPALPRGCVPYLPCSVETLLRVAELAEISENDVFVDLGAGVGRAVALMHLLSGATSIGVEIQPQLVEAARELAGRLNTTAISVLEGDAAQLTNQLSSGSVFFLYCPFSGDRLARVLAQLEIIARERSIRVCCVDMPPIAEPWLTRRTCELEELAIYHSMPVAALTASHESERAFRTSAGEPRDRKSDSLR